MLYNTASHSSQLLNRIFRAIGIPVDMIYLDLSKAFDSVPYERLILEFRAYGIQGNILEQTVVIKSNQ